jgi:hypothetical protein
MKANVTSAVLPLLAVFLHSLPTVAQDKYFNHTYNYLKTTGLSQVLFECGLARKYYNSIGNSYWSNSAITSRRRALLALKNSNEEYTNVIESAKAAVMRETCPEVW